MGYEKMERDMRRDMERDLQRAIEDKLGCKALWERWQIVRVMDGPTVTVGVFRLANYQDATRCYAWANPEQGAKPYVVLRRGTAHDPITTVLSVLRLGRA